jgi:hypothetical protein
MKPLRGRLISKRAAKRTTPHPAMTCSNQLQNASLRVVGLTGLATASVRIDGCSLLKSLIQSLRLLLLTFREPLDNRSPVGAAPCTNWDLRALTGAAEGFSRASLGFWPVPATGTIQRLPDPSGPFCHDTSPLDPFSNAAAAITRVNASWWWFAASFVPETALQLLRMWRIRAIRRYPDAGRGMPSGGSRVLKADSPSSRGWS